MSRKTLGMISGRVRVADIGNLDSGRYEFLSLENAEPNPGAPSSNNGILGSATDGTRSWLIPNQGLSVSGSNDLFVDETSVPIDTAGYNYSSSSVLSDVLADLDQNIANATAGNLNAVVTDSTLTGDGTSSNPLSVATAGDAETLGGELPAYYLNYNNFTNTPTIGDGTITVSGGTGLSGSASFSTNQTTNQTITLSNDDRGSSQNIFKNVAVSGQNTIVADSNNDTLNIIGGSSISVSTDSATDTLTIDFDGTATDNYVDSVTFDSGTGDLTLGRTGTLGDLTTNLDGRYLTAETPQNLFETIAVSGQNSIVADSATDTLTFAEGSNVTLATDSGTDTVTISATDTNDYVNSASFGTGDGILSLNRTDAGTVTVDLDGRYLLQNATAADSNLLDGQDGTYYLNYNNFTNTPTIGNGTLTVSGGTGLSGSGTFDANQTTNESITLTNTDPGSGQNIFKTIAVSGQTDITADSNSDTLQFAAGTNVTIATDATNDTVTVSADDNYVDSMSFNTQIGVLTLTRTDSSTVTENLDGRYLVQGTPASDSNLLGGQPSTYYLDYNNFNNTPTIGDGTLTVSGGSGLTGSGTFSANQGTNDSITLNHADTSTQGSVDNSGGTVVQDIDLDGYGHVTGLGSIDLDSRYYTQSTADSRYVNESGDTMTGFLTLHADPTNGLHAATKRYVDDVAQGLNVKPSDYVATTTNLNATYSTANNTLTSNVDEAISVDSTSLTVGETVLVKDQTDAYENGSYSVTQVGDSSNPWILTRTEFMDETDEIPGAFEFIENGATNDSTGWVATVPEDFALNDTTATTDPDFTTKGDIVWVQFSGAGTYTAGAGLDLTGNEFSHTDTSSVSNLTASSRTYVDSLTFDTFGHVTGYTTSSETVVNTDTNDYVSSMSFNTSTGVLTLTRTDAGTVTEDLDGRYLVQNATAADSNLLDGQDGTYYLNYNNFTNTPTIGNGTLTVSGGSGLTGTGTFDANQTTNNTVTIDHADTSTQGSVDNSGGTVIQDVTLDGFGHVTGLGSVDLDSRYINTNGDATLFGDLEINGGIGPAQLVIKADSDNSNEDDVATILLSQDGDIVTAQFGIDNNNAAYLQSNYGGTDVILKPASGQAFVNSSRIFTDGYHPNADTLTTARSISLGGDLSGSASFDGSTNITITATVADNSHNHIISNIDGLQTALDSKADESIIISSGGGLTGGGDLTANRTISHADTSSQGSSTNSGRTYIQSIGLDGYGHVTSLATATETVTDTNDYVTSMSFNTSTGVLTLTRTDAGTVTEDLDGRYLTSYTETDTLDSVTDRGSSTTNTIGVGGVTIDSSYDLDSDTGSTSSTTQTSVASFSSSAYGSAKLIVQISDSVTGERQISELLVAHDGTNAFATEYGVVYTGTAPLATFDADISSGNVRLLATAASGNSTSYTVSETLMV